jgi:nuclear pore complex protein Nup98-Nup96
VRWEGYTDVRGGVLEAVKELVHFGRGWAEVYPKGGAWVKPPRGQGLNRPATISLHGCRPEPGCTLSAFIARLRATPNTRFLAYCPISGTWTFTVEHFTRYGLSNDDSDDSEDEDEENEEGLRRSPAFRLPAQAVPLKGKQTKAPVRGATPYTRSARYAEEDDGDEEELEAEAEPSMEEEDDMYARHAEEVDEDDISEELDEEGVDIEEEEEVDEEPPGRTPPPALSRLTPSRYATAPHGFYATQSPNPSLPQQLGLESRRIQQMKASLFPTEQPAEQPAAPVTRSPSSLTKPSGYTTSRPSIGSLAPLTIPPARTVSLNQLPLGKGSITHMKEAQVIDAGLFLGRSFRVGWAPGGVLFHSGSASFSRSSSSVLQSQPRPDRIQLGVVHREHVFSSSRSEDEYTVGLEHHYNCNAGNQSTIREEVDDNKEPRWGIAPEQVRAFIAANERSSEQACRQENVTGFKAMLSRHDHQVWALAKSLWGTHESLEQYLENTDEGEAERSRWKELARRTALSKWLETTLRDEELRESGAEGEATYLHRLLTLLSVHQLEDAVKLALEKRDFHLACMIPRAGQASLRKDLDAQVAVWLEKGFEEHMHPLRFTVYSLLAGRLGSLQQ